MGNQPGLTCEHVAVQVERRQVAACKQKPRGDNRVKPHCSWIFPRALLPRASAGGGGGGGCAEPAQAPAAGPVFQQPHTDSSAGEHGQAAALGPRAGTVSSPPFPPGAPAHRPAPLGVAPLRGGGLGLGPWLLHPPALSPQWKIRMGHRNCTTGARQLGPRNPHPFPLATNTVVKTATTYQRLG